jgi:hypothetical protein
VIGRERAGIGIDRITSLRWNTQAGGWAELGRRGITGRALPFPLVDPPAGEKARASSPSTSIGISHPRTHARNKWETYGNEVMERNERPMIARHMWTDPIGFPGRDSGSLGARCEFAVASVGRNSCKRRGPGRLPTRRNRCSSFVCCFHAARIPKTEMWVAKLAPFWPMFKKMAHVWE